MVKIVSFEDFKKAEEKEELLDDSIEDLEDDK